ncbi:MAG: transcription antitermination factor NusB [Acidimicrobiales bacterium]
MTVPARAIALRVLRRIESDGAYANLVLGPELERSRLDQRDRAFVTELVYGTTRMRRACDHLAERFITRAVDHEVRTILRLGAYQVAFTGVADHAAVGETVELAPKRARGFVNAILRRVADSPVVWPDDATRLSYPDWIVERLTADLGHDQAVAALEAMNEPAAATERADGYTQDLASQWVAELVEAGPGLRVADLCAAPGGKATALAAAGAHVAALDLRPGRVGLVGDNARRLGVTDRVAALVGDAARPPLRPGSFDRVLLDAPCSGLGALRRRADARWRIDAGSVERLAALQRRLVDAAVALVAPGGLLVYSVCTFTASETLGVDEHLAAAHPELQPLPAPERPWRRWGRGALLLPQDAGTDGMAVLRLRRL